LEFVKKHPDHNVLHDYHEFLQTVIRMIDFILLYFMKYKMNFKSPYLTNLIRKQFSDAQHSSGRFGCDEVYRGLRGIKAVKNLAKSLQQECHRHYYSYDIPGTTFKFVKDCPEDDSCDCGGMHPLLPSDPGLNAIATDVAQIKRLFQACKTQKLCNDLYNVFRKCDAVKSNPHIHSLLKQFRKECIDRLVPRINWEVIYECPENPNPETQLSRLQEYELFEIENKAIGFKDYTYNRISELFDRCNCGNFHFGKGIERFLQLKKRLPQCHPRQHPRQPKAVVVNLDAKCVAATAPENVNNNFIFILSILSINLLHLPLAIVNTYITI